MCAVARVRWLPFVERFCCARIVLPTPLGMYKLPKVTTVMTLLTQTESRAEAPFAYKGDASRAE